MLNRSLRSRVREDLIEAIKASKEFEGAEVEENRIGISVKCDDGVKFYLDITLESWVDHETPPPGIRYRDYVGQGEGE